MSILTVNQLSSGYEGKRMIEDISFQLKAGEILGLIGSNGAGKTTLIKSILGIIPTDSGSVKVVGGSHQEKAMGSIGYVPEMPLLYDELTLLEHLEFSAMANGMAKDPYIQERNKLLEIFNMKDKLNHYPNSFSKGMKQKVMIMCMLLLNPSLLIFDEPFIGLDPKAIKTLVDMMYRKRQEGAGILMSTHVLDSAEKICDRFVIINHGRLLFQGTLEELRQTANMPQGSLLEIFDELVVG